MPVITAPRHLRDRYDVTIVGGGPAGLAAAVGARERGADAILVIDRDPDPGGILLQCIHRGFGLHTFGEDLTGPEYAHLALQQALEHEVDVVSDSFVEDVTRDGRVRLLSPTLGPTTLQTATTVLATGARERSRAAISIPGARPAGVLTAGVAQQMVNLHGYLPGRRVVILGSGDIGLVMARRLHLEGVEVVGVYELLPYASGLGRNVVQCLEDLDIPLHLSTTVVEVHGDQRVERVTLAPVDERRQPILSRAFDVDCDTLVLSVGLVPDDELARNLGLDLDPRTRGPRVSSTMETSLPGVFAAGNTTHVNDLADWVSQEARAAGHAAAELVLAGDRPPQDIALMAGDNVAYTVPHTLSSTATQTISLRVRQPIHGPTVLRIGDVTRRKIRAAVPPEMITIKLGPAALEGHAGTTLRVDAIPAAQEGVS